MHNLHPDIMFSVSIYCRETFYTPNINRHVIGKKMQLEYYYMDLLILVLLDSCGGEVAKHGENKRTLKNALRGC